MKLIYELLITIFLTCIITFIYQNQARTLINNGKGYDGFYYYKICENIQKEKNPIVGEAPFINRVGTFWLISNFSSYSKYNLLKSAEIVNYTGGFLTILLLVIWLRIYIKTYSVRLILTLLFCTCWFLPLRIVKFYPMTSDPWGAFWFLLGLIMLNLLFRALNEHKNKLFYLFLFSIIVSIGTLFRESNIILAFSILFYDDPIRYKSIFKLNFVKNVIFKRSLLIKLFFVSISVLFTITIKFLTNRYIEKSNFTNYSYLDSIVHWFYLKSLPQFLLGFFLAYGPIISILPFIKDNKTFLLKNQSLSFLLICGFGLSYIGGSDTERILYYLTFPIILVLIGISIKNLLLSNQKWYLILILILQTIAYRLFWLTPDFEYNNKIHILAFFNLIGNKFPHLFLYSQHGNIILNTILLIQYIFILFLSSYIIKNKIELKTPFSK